MKLTEKLTEDLQPLLNELLPDYCQNKYCILKKILCNLQPSLYLLWQIKCVEIYKWEQNQNSSKEISWNEAFELWVKNGFAESYSIIYADYIKNNKELKIKKIYKDILNKIK